MSFQISEQHLDSISAISNLSYSVAGLLIGRKVLQLAACGGCKVGGMMARNRGQENGDDWTKASKEYLLAAKKDLIRDLTLTTNLFFVGKAGSAIVHQKNIEIFAESIELDVKILKLFYYVSAVTVALYLAIKKFHQPGRLQDLEIIQKCFPEYFDQDSH